MTTRTPPSFAIVTAAVGITTALVVALVACGSSSSASVDRAALAQGCLIDSDCAAPLRCAFKSCHNACEESRDCPAGQRCVAADRPFNVCQLPTEVKCNYNSDCPASQRCGSDRQCRDQCAATVDCIGGQVCTTGVCAESTELVNGSLPAPSGGTPLVNEGQTCNRPSDCVLPLTCLQGVCGYECVEDRDCSFSRSCVAHTCHFLAADGGTLAGNECLRPSDCPLPLVCLFQHCAYQCVEDRDCGGNGLHCAAHVCN